MWGIHYYFSILPAECSSSPLSSQPAQSLLSPTLISFPATWPPRFPLFTFMFTFHVPVCLQAFDCASDQGASPDICQMPNPYFRPNSVPLPPGQFLGFANPYLPFLKVLLPSLPSPAPLHFLSIYLAPLTILRILQSIRDKTSLLVELTLRTSQTQRLLQNQRNFQAA